MDPLEIISRLGSDDAPTDEELTEARTEFKSLLKNAVTEREPGWEDEATHLEGAIKLIDGEIADRKAAAEKEAEKAQKYLEVVGEDEEPEEDPEASAEEEEEPEEEGLAQPQRKPDAQRDGGDREDRGPKPGAAHADDDGGMDIKTVGGVAARR